MKKSLPQNNIDKLKAPDVIREDAVRNDTVTPSGAFSLAAKIDPATLNPFEDTNDSLFILQDYMMVYEETFSKDDKEWKKNMWEALKNHNSRLSYPFTEESLMRLYKDRDVLKTPIETKTLSLSELMSQEFPKARYVVEPFFEQGTVNMVSAPPNTWKSWLLFYMSSKIATGDSVFDQKKFSTEKSKVMIVNEEDSHRSVQDRFKMLGITDTSLEIYFRIAQGSKLENKFITELITELKEKEINTVIFDSLRSMHVADENDSTAMQTILDHMKKISREGISVIFTHHNRKKSPFDRGTTPESSRGSSAINAAISGHISLDEKMRDDHLYLVVNHLKSKAGEKIQPIEIEIVRKNDVMQFVYQGEMKSDTAKLIQVKNQIIDVLQEGGWLTVREMRLNQGKSIVRQAVASLLKEGLILDLTVKECIRKLIAVPHGSRPNEKLYSMNTEVGEIEQDMEEEQLSLDAQFNEI